VDKEKFVKYVKALNKFGKIHTVIPLECPWNPNVAIAVNSVAIFAIRIYIFDGEKTAILKAGDFISYEKSVEKLTKILMKERPMLELIQEFKLPIDDLFMEVQVSREELKEVLDKNLLKPGVWLRTRKSEEEKYHDAIYMGFNKEINKHQVAHFFYDEKYKKANEQLENSEVRIDDISLMSDLYKFEIRVPMMPLPKSLDEIVHDTNKEVEQWKNLK